MTTNYSTNEKKDKGQIDDDSIAFWGQTVDADYLRDLAFDHDVNNFSDIDSYSNNVLSDSLGD